MSNFWQKLTKPFTVLAPMDDVTDNVFRQIILSAARPDVFFTEFTSADGLVYNSHGVPRRKLTFTEEQRPIVAQIWGNNAENMGKATKIVRDLGFDGIDINMGCPVREVVKAKAGAGLIGEYELAGKVIRAVKTNSGDLPVSVKTRLGINTNIAADWIKFLLEQDLPVITLHARTAKQMSKVPANWDEIGKIVELKNNISPNTLIIGNGDVKNYPTVLDFHEKYNIDGVMIGRGIFDNPWVFDKTDQTRSVKDHFDLMEKHINLFENIWGDSKNFAILKKFFKIYIKDFRGAAELRQEFMESKDKDEIKSLMEKFRATAIFET